MAVTIRRPQPDDLESWIRGAHVGFLDPGEVEAAAAFRRPIFDFSRARGAWDGERCVATFRSFASDLTLPGGTTATSCAITGVTVSPTHRRRGLLSELMATELREAADRGEPAAVLIASEWPIYGRFGFGAATEAVTYELDKTRASFRHGRPDAGLEIRLVEPAELVKVAPAIFERFRVRRPGSIDRNRPKWWETNLGVIDAPGMRVTKGFAAVASDASGEPQGYVRYHADDRWDDRVCRTTLVIDELTATTDEATGALWRFAASVDLAVSVRAEQRPVDEWIGWELTDARAFRQLSRADLLWLRPLDVPRLLEARRYGTSGRLVLEVRDPDGLAGGRFALDASAAGASCRPTDAQPDACLSAAALGSIYLGGHAPATLRRAGLLEADDATVATLGRLFASDPAPWCNTWF